MAVAVAFLGAVAWASRTRMAPRAQVRMVDNPIAELRKGMQRQGAGTRADMVRWPSRDPADPYLRVAPGAWVFPKSDPFTAEDYAREDDGDDVAYFERNARFMPTASTEVAAALARHYDRHIMPDSRVLDLCAGAFTQLPLEWPLEVTGLGLNGKELAANRRLAHREVFNLNAIGAGGGSTQMPFDDGAFDCVLLNGGAVGILKDPVAVLRDVYRVLTPGGTVLISFGKEEGDRVKQTARWHNSNPQQRMYLGASWLHFAAGAAPDAWTEMRGYDISPTHRPDRNVVRRLTRAVASAVGGEELLYVLQATRQPQNEAERALATERERELLLSTAKFQVTKQLKVRTRQGVSAGRCAAVTPARRLNPGRRPSGVC